MKKKEIDLLRVIKEVILKESEALKIMAESIDLINYKALIDLIIHTKGKIIISGIGKSGHVARKIAASISSIGFGSFFLHPAEAGHGDLGMISKEDVVMLISNSGETIELNHIIDYCKRFDIPIVGVTREGKSTLSSSSNITILLPKVPEVSDIDIPTTSSIMAMAFGDSLAVSLKETIQLTKEEYKKYHPSGKIGMKLIYVNEVMHIGKDIPIVSEKVNILDAIVEMTSKRLGCVVVVNEKGLLKGIFTDGDLARSISLNLSNTLISEVMTKSPISISENTLASDAMRIMDTKNINHLIVVENKKPKGVLHIHDLIKIGKL